MLKVAEMPIRVRLVAGYIAALALLLFLSATFVYIRVHMDLDTQLDHDLGDRLVLLTARIAADGKVTADPGLAEFQILDASNQVLASGPAAPSESWLTPRSFRSSTRDRTTLQIGRLLPGSPRPLRLLAAPLKAGTARVAVVGVRRDLRDESLRELIATLGLASAAALTIAALVGYRLAAAALEPVERYRAQAASIGTGTMAMLLEVPERPDDEITRLGHTFNQVLSVRDAAVDHERRFVADASHELRTPITLLMTRVQLLRRSGREPERDDQQLGEMERDVVELVQLTDSLLALASAHDRPDPSGEAAPSCDLTSVVQDLGFEQLDILVDLPSGPVMAATSEQHVRQVARNLIANATTHGAAPVTLSVRREAAAGVLTVSDSGTGIDADLLPHVTERFRRSDEARNRPGSGLGLAIVDALVRTDGAALRICSNGVHDALCADAADGHGEVGTTVRVAWRLVTASDELPTGAHLGFRP